MMRPLFKTLLLLFLTIFITNSVSAFLDGMKAEIDSLDGLYTGLDIEPFKQNEILLVNAIHDLKGFDDWSNTGEVNIYAISVFEEEIKIRELKKIIANNIFTLQSPQIIVTDENFDFFWIELHRDQSTICHISCDIDGENWSEVVKRSLPFSGMSGVKLFNTGRDEYAIIFTNYDGDRIFFGRLTNDGITPGRITIDGRSYTGPFLGNQYGLIYEDRFYGIAGGNDALFVSSDNIQSSITLNLTALRTKEDYSPEKFWEILPLECDDQDELVVITEYQDFLTTETESGTLIKSYNYFAVDSITDNELVRKMKFNMDEDSGGWNYCGYCRGNELGFAWVTRKEDFGLWNFHFAHGSGEILKHYEKKLDYEGGGLEMATQDMFFMNGGLWLAFNGNTGESMTTTIIIHYPASELIP